MTTMRCSTATLTRGQTVYPVATLGDFVTVEDSLGREHLVMRGDLDITTEGESK